jgi:exodeoxyribonuclease-5
MLIGDTAQLPPVGEQESPALSADMIAGYGLAVSEMTLTQVVRQLSESGILWNATALRRALADEDIYDFPRLRLTPDVIYLSGSELIEELEQAYYECGIDDIIVVTRSNARAKAFNLGIRGRILDYEEELSSGDRVVIVKNNYHWIKPDAEQLAKTYEREQLRSQGQQPEDVDANDETGPTMEFIANGDMAVVRRYRNEREAHGFRFADATLTFPDFDDMEIDATILLDTLTSEAPALTNDQQEELFQRVWNDYPELKTKQDRMKAIKNDPYFNALQVKYAYAVTCHKAQGGQWSRVFLDQGYVTEDMLGPDYYRWLYTALTRATEKVYLINWPKQGLEDASSLE